MPVKQKLHVLLTCTDVFSWQMRLHSALQQSEYRSFSQLVYTFCLSAHINNSIKLDNSNRTQQ